MDQLYTYDNEPVYDHYVPPTTDVAPTGVVAGWSFTF